VSNIIRRHTDNTKLFFVCILLWSHSFIFFRFYFFINVFLFNTVIYVFLLICLCILIIYLFICIVPVVTLRLPWMRFSRAFSSVVRHVPGYNPTKTGQGPHSSKIFLLFCVFFVLCRSLYCLCVNVYCTTATGWLPNCN